MDDFARIGPKATPAHAQESSRDGRLENPRRRVPVTKARRRRPAEAFRRRGRQGRREVGLSIAKRVGELANKRNGSSHGRRASHDRFPSIAGRSGLLRDLLQSDVPAFDAYRLRNLVARSVYSAPGDRKRAQLHLSRLRFPANLDLAALVRSSGAGCGSLIALSEKAPARVARSGSYAHRDNMTDARNESRRALASKAVFCQIEAGRLAVDVPLANRVRSGRKQP